MMQLLHDEEFVKSKLENALKEEIDNCHSLEETLQWKQFELENDFMIKLRERDLKVKEEYWNELEERMNNISKNLNLRYDIRDRNPFSKIERKIDEIAAFEDYFLRAKYWKHDVGK